MKSYKTIPANDEYSIRKYLGSGAIKGLGLALADRIVDKFKEDTFRIVDEEPERLEEVRGISYKKAMDIASQIQAKKRYKRRNDIFTKIRYFVGDES